VTLERGDLGFSAFSILKRRLGETLALSIHLSLIASIVIIAIYFSRKYKMEIREFMVWYLPVPFAIMIFANPRLKEYDIVILLLLLVTWLTLRGGSSGQDALLVAFGLFLLRSFLFLVQTPLKIKIHDSLIYLKYWEFLITIMLLIWMLSIPPKKIKVEIE
jgi:hypothetical protein